MKHLTDYIEEEQTKIFNETGCFFAFSEEQFKNKTKKGVEYVDLGGGLICPKGKEREIEERLERNYKEGIKKDLEENGKEGVIRRELYNHEAFYTWEIDQTVDSLKDYEEITEEDVRKIFVIESKKVAEDDNY